LFQLEEALSMGRALSRNALSAGAAALLAACGGSQPPVGAPSAIQQSSAFVSSRNVSPASSYKQLHRFGRPVRPYQRGGTQPQAALIDVNGTLYGTTTYGGRRCPHPGYVNGEPGCGTVFSISPSGVWKLLHSFRGGASDGAHPYATLIDVNGTLYGTTEVGGGTGCGGVGCGTVYSITTSGVETVLHSFTAGSDGAVPFSELTNVNGTLYGTTSEGGGTYCGSAYGCGTVYRISTSGGEKVLYAFGSPSSTAGYIPVSGLVGLNGILYGTTGYGGRTCKGLTYTCGTVYSVTTHGVLKTLYKFKGRSDGAFPASTLVNVNGTLYGTTFGGSLGPGTVYSITTAGAEKVLHNFRGGSDGYWPHSGLIDVNGTLFGTTEIGGSGGGCGTIYSITTSDKEKVVYSFTCTPDGQDPDGTLLDVNGTLYGTTMHGGIPKCDAQNFVGCGTVFSLSSKR
jgi:uncharacterized repeat protein (TIGR03803 family)